MELERVARLFEASFEQIGKVIVGQAEVAEAALVALFSEGSVLIEGAPGLAKTLLVNTLSRIVSCEFKRAQFTPDLMPSDLTGHNVYDLSENRFHFNAGPIFTNLLLADEINRSPPKTQSALLEAMQERQVTIDGTVHRLDLPFLVIGTQNPLEHEGTYPLPEAQVDRFMFKLLMDYPSPEEEAEILARLGAGKDSRDIQTFGVEPVLRKEEIGEIQTAVSKVIVEPSVVDYITRIVAKTREWHSVSVGASPRGSINLFLASRTLAGCHGRDFVTPDDVKEICPLVLRHRLTLRPETEIEGVTADQVIGQILESVEVPRS